MTDTRKVRPVAPLDAERAEGDGWNVRFPRAGSQRATPSDVYLWWADAAFAAAFMPAELFDAVLDAARAVSRWEEAHPNIRVNLSLHEVIERTCVAVRAFDAARTEQGL